MVRRIILLLLVCIASSSAALAAPFIPANDRHFDHDAHAAAVSKLGRPAAACATCHTMDKNGVPTQKGKTEHARCFDACHDHPYTQACDVRGGALKSGGVVENVCITCHPDGKSKCGHVAGSSSQPNVESFTAHFAHAAKGHTDLTLEKACARCHRAEAKAVDPQPTGTGHGACSQCHGQAAKPAMTECAACHVGKQPKAQPKHDPFQLEHFDHAAHTATAKAGRCYACHNQATGEKLRPTMLNCQIACHDGVKAFAATGTSCTKCHRASDPAVAARTDLAFSHADHAKRNVKVDDCASCHALDTEGLVAAPGKGKDHKTCSANGCHQNEFLSRTTKICGACHDTPSPWVKSIARVRERPTSEYYEKLDHSVHLKANGTTNQSCASCHGDKMANGPRPTGHKACAQCHNKQKNPPMTECAGCHVRGQVAHPAASEWSVARTFKHDTHATDRRSGKATACVQCHDKIAGARDLATVAMPKMQTCDGCHDGKLAFKSTGFGCARCHARGASK